MKQSVAKTLGVAVAGAALAASGAGAASAAGLPNLSLTDAVGQLTDATGAVTNQTGEKGGASDLGSALGPAQGLIGGLPLNAG
ncbi:hypothetical protein ACN20G_08500 [Streptomyces sp. BI20]|uniref:hypothetical protein n=1 Tax=Streptomyces sp. BI20 TaxID=3403460 RepID=UPI003C77A5ED